MSLVRFYSCRILDTCSAPSATVEPHTRRCPLVVSIAATLLLSGCGADTAAPVGVARVSLFLPRNIRVQAMLKKQDGTPGPVMIEIHGSPVSVVYPRLEQAHAKHQEYAAKLVTQIEERQDDVIREQLRLEETNAAVSVEYNDMVPEKSEATARTARNPLQHLSQARARKTEADNWLRQAHADRIAPVERLIDSLQSQLEQLRLNLTAHHENLPNVLFAALPETPHTWKTNKDGEETISIPPGEPWCFWATYRLEQQRVRWIQDSEDADGNGKLSFDETNTFDGAPSLPSSLNSVLRPD